MQKLTGRRFAHAPCYGRSQMRRSPGFVAEGLRDHQAARLRRVKIRPFETTAPRHSRESIAGPVETSFASCDRSSISMLAPRMYGSESVNRQQA